MYSVVRFCFPETLRDEAERLGKTLNHIIPDVFTGMGNAPNQFSCSLSEATEWSQHLNEITLFLRRCEAALDSARKCGFAICIDVAVEPEDYAFDLYQSLAFDLPFLSALTSRGVALTVTLYAPLPRREQGEAESNLQAARE